MSDSYFQGLMQSDARGGTNRKPPSPPAPAKARRTGLARNLEGEAILDIRQQAEFFVSLGQPEQALRILKRQIEEGEEPNPLVYLDLLGVAHLLGLRVEFQRLREEFKHLFKGRVPEFVFFAEEGRSLESYPEVLSRVTALWPTPAALALLESCIFQDNPDASAQPFDLAAFRDLLLLHAIVYSVALTPDLPGTGATPASTLPKLGPAPASDMELDLDLSDSPPAGLASPPDSLADVDLPLLMPDEPAGVKADPVEPLDRGNLIDFDLPLDPMLPGSTVDRSRLR